MSLASLTHWLGQDVVYIPTNNGIPTLAKVVDVRLAFGRVDVRLESCLSTRHWVDASRCQKNPIVK
jgi:hypothetical protein